MENEMKNRYSRQILMPEVGEQGQKRLNEASVLLIGLGGLGSPAALYLAAAGVGRLGLIDFDKVDVSNLHRQILYDTTQQGEPKTAAAEVRLRNLNPDVNLEVFNEKLTIENAKKIFDQFDIILDGADNFATRYLTNDAAFFSKKTLVSASVLGFEGQLTVFAPNSLCYRCLYPEPPPQGLVPSCAEAGVLGVAPGLMGILQANEVLKIILNIGDSLKSKLLLVNLLSSEFTKLQIEKNPDCPLCGVKPSITELKEENFVCSTDVKIKEISMHELKQWSKTYQLLDVRETSEFTEGILNYTHHIPLQELELKYHDLSQETAVVVYCRSGGRSMKACTFLQSKGYLVYNLTGGIQKNLV